MCRFSKLLLFSFFFCKDGSDRLMKRASFSCCNFLCVVLAAAYLKYRRCRLSCLPFVWHFFSLWHTHTHTHCDTNPTPHSSSPIWIYQIFPYWWWRTDFCQILTNKSITPCKHYTFQDVANWFEKWTQSELFFYGTPQKYIITGKLDCEHSQQSQTVTSNTRQDQKKFLFPVTK